MMIGVSMAAAMIICIAAFIWLYVQIGPLLSDFIPEDTAGDDPGETTGLIGAVDRTPTPGTGPLDDFALDEIEPEPADTANEENGEAEADDEAASDATSDDNEAIDDDPTVDDAIAEVPEVEFEPTHEIREGPNVNFRSGPNTISQPQGSLPPGTPLEFMGDEEPAGGVVWMFFEIEDGTEGWIRDIDVIEIDGDDAEVDDD